MLVFPLAIRLSSAGFKVIGVDLDSKKIEKLKNKSIRSTIKFYLDLIGAIFFIGLMGRRKTQKIIKTGPKNVTTGMCPLCKTIGRIFIIGQVGEERAKCPACNQSFDL